MTVMSLLLKIQNKTFTSIFIAVYNIQDFLKRYTTLSWVNWVRANVILNKSINFGSMCIKAGTAAAAISKHTREGRGFHFHRGAEREEASSKSKC